MSHKASAEDVTHSAFKPFQFTFCRASVLTNGMQLLAISGLSVESSQLHQQGLYWLACDAAEDASLLCRQVVEGMPDNARAALIADAQAMDDVLGALDATRGPAELALYEANSQATRYLVEDLPRLDARGRVLVLLAPAHAWADTEVEHWCNALRPALLAEAALLLVVGDRAPPWSSACAFSTSASTAWGRCTAAKVGCATCSISGATRLAKQPPGTWS